MCSGKKPGKGAKKVEEGNLAQDAKTTMESVDLPDSNLQGSEKLDGQKREGGAGDQKHAP